MGYFWNNNNNIEHESNDDRNKNLSVKEQLNEIKPYLRGIIINLQNSDWWKVQSLITIKIISWRRTACNALNKW